MSLNSCILWDGGTGSSIGTSTIKGLTAQADYSIVDSTAFDVSGTVIDLDPMFLDAPGGDHRLAAGSPGIDSGDPALGLDPDGSDPDMGSHPYQNQ